MANIRIVAMYENLHGPITTTVRIYLASRILGLALLFLLVGLVFLYLIGRSSKSRRRHGVFVLEWMIAGWLAAGLASIPHIDGDRYWPGEADLGAAGFGMLAGWSIGMIHGSLILWLWPERSAKPVSESKDG